MNLWMSDMDSGIRFCSSPLKGLVTAPSNTCPRE
nr:MAG: hypothetical protein [Molluscum contagiosum virus]